MQDGSVHKVMVLCGVVVLVAGVMLADAAAAAEDDPPGVEWTDQFGTTDIDYSRGVAVYGNGVYVAGSTGGALPGQASAGGPDVYVRKYGHDRSEVWTRQFGSTPLWWGGDVNWNDYGSGVAADASGVYVTGTTEGDGLPGQTNAGSCDVFVRKYDHDGNEQWTDQFGTVQCDSGNGVAVDATGLYVTGSTGGAFPGHTSSGAIDVFVRKYDHDGNEQWTRQFGTNEAESGEGVEVYGNGVYVTGSTGGAFPGHTSSGAIDVFVRKYNAVGNIQWTRQFGTTSTDRGYGVAVDATGVYVTGWARGALPDQTNTGEEDAFVRKFDHDGPELWTRQFGTDAEDSGRGVAVDATGVYVTGTTTGVLPGQTSAGYLDVFLRRYDPDGNEVWTRQFGTAGGNWGEGVAVDVSGVYVCGYTTGAFPGHTNAGRNDVFVRKYDTSQVDCLGAAATIVGSNAADTLSGTTGDDVIHGMGGGDTIDGMGGNDVICGGAGYDVIKGGPGDDTIDGGAGQDRVSYLGAPAGVSVNLMAGMASGGHGSDTLVSVERVSGTGWRDVIVGNGAGNHLIGFAGNDTLRGWGGPDIAIGGNGNDVLDGGGGDDSLRGGNGDDVADYKKAPAGVTVSLATGIGSGQGDDQLLFIERIWGSGHNDHLVGNWLANLLHGQAGNDTLEGLGGDDTLYGGPGTDVANGGPGTDTCYAESMTSC